VYNDITSKEASSGGKKCVALFDTGSKFNIIREDVYNEIKRPKLESCAIFIIGVGNSDS